MALVSLACAKQEVVIKVDGKVIRHQTLQHLVGSVLQEAGVVLQPADVVEPSRGFLVRNGLEIVVHRALKVEIQVDGEKRVVFTQPTSVQKVLEMAGIHLGRQDQVDPPLDRFLREDALVKVTRVTEEIVTEKYFLPAPVERRPDPSLERGCSRVLNSGEPGEGERVVKVVYADGKEIKRVVIQDRVVRPPKSKVVAYGTLDTISRGGQTFKFRQMIEVVATAYGPSVGKYTATGHRVQRGIVAVDPRVIPLGSRLYIEGYGFARALDVGSSIRGNRIDVFFESEATCRKWGRRRVKVYILE
ncbi:MAG TPA: hypothetical protein DCE07_04125 [Peptococcaceae bacterium]|nr:hypothetical protein [Peptococcaceae bacterium]